MDSTEFLEFLETQETYLPKSVIEYFLRHYGFDEKDDRVVKLIGLATRKFMEEIIIKSRKPLPRSFNQQNNSQQQKKENQPKILTTEDLIGSLKQSGHTIRKLTQNQIPKPEPQQLATKKTYRNTRKRKKTTRRDF
ncbi:transcription initiation factor tfiid subunit 10 [Anaeramoeba flamelloides]|uniref:Transcription initiation factor tfiid subunit n=1 Tax=Anaeramoeba flamelloides TaxID=1746091 RepID=A0AAV7Y766_9EUKA|nr:transcription initiation factor tfiid subunit [Anaeramoeba flamelloides]KAJ6236892.1 transcription initiation factor tfiid subunit 10 [Anaeramoeba flamelloides]